MNQIVIRALFLFSTLLTLSCTTNMKANGNENFPAHPGFLVYHYVYNNTSEKIDEKTVPDGIKFRYYNAQGHSTSAEQATRRTPVTRIEITSVDRAGELCAPENAYRIFMTYYDAMGRALDHTSSGPMP